MNQQLCHTFCFPLASHRFVEGQHTTTPSDSEHRLADTQVTQWKGFEQEQQVLQYMITLPTPSPDNFDPNRREECFMVGNETGF